MGGRGSGSYYRFNSKDKTSESLPLDIRELYKKQLLKPGHSITSKWSRAGNCYASISGRVFYDYLLLEYTYQKTEQVKQRIDFDFTPCNYGGQRVWFTCPYCGRRCAVIYSRGKYFACRLCCNLTYPTQCESDAERLLTKAGKLRDRIGAEPGCLNGLPFDKPKGMHHKTWDLIRFQILELEDIGLLEAGKRWGELL